MPIPSSPAADPLHTVEVGPRRIGVPAERRWAFRDGRYYELSVEHWLDRMMGASPAPVLYDVGANIGYYGVRFADTAAHVYAFEPVASTFAILDENFRRNELPNATAVRVGLSDVRGEATIHLWSSSGSNTLYARDIPHDALGTETIELARLDDLAAREGWLGPTVMKIDIEGAELPALRGARRLIEEHRPHLIVECVAAACHDAGYSQEALFRELRDHGYELRGLSPAASDMRLHPVDAATPIENVLGFPPGSPLLAGPDLSEVTGEALGAFVTVAALDEVLETPELLADYARVFGAGDDATLVIHAPEGDAAEHLEQLAKVVDAFGFDEVTMPDVLALAHPPTLIAAPVRRAADAVLSGRPARRGYATCPHFAPGELHRLRALAGRRVELA